MHETHKEIDRWGEQDFPFNHNDEHVMERLHDLLPHGYWLAFDYSADEEVAIVLLKNEGHA